MMLAVGAYSGPRAVWGAVAQLAKNARDIAAAMTHVPIDIVDCLRFISSGDSFESFRYSVASLPCVHHFANKTLGLSSRSFSCNARQNSRHDLVHESSDFGLE